jgi:Rieske Fe-S protein
MTVRSDEAEAELESSGASRRAFLAAGGGACLALLLGACTSDPEPTAPPAEGTDADDQGDDVDADPTSDPPGDETDADENDNSGGEVLAKVSDLPVGGGKVVGEVLLVNLGGGRIKAYDAHCTHQGFIVNPPKNGRIVCPNHGSAFQASDGGVVQGPAMRGLTAIKVKVDGGNVVRV